MPAVKDTNKYFCERCKKTLAAVKFYTYKDGTKVELCKDCLCAHVDNFDPSTFLWILEKMDVPYIKQEWNILRDKAFQADPKKVGGAAVLGRYLGKMKLKQYINPETGKTYGWADSEMLQAKADANSTPEIEMTEEEIEELKKRNEDLKIAYEKGEISEAEYRTLVPTETQREEAEAGAISFPGAQPAPSQGGFIEDNFISEDELPNPAAELTEEDKIYLAMKWGRLYKPNEWVELEKKYTEMMDSFDIQDADSRNTLILMCKTDLKMNQCLDLGDIDGYQKLARVSDSLRKSGHFTAAQNKDKDNDQISCVGQVVAFCEREGGFIPRFVTDAPQDIVDKIIEDSNKYTYNLVTKELGFGQQIENYLKKIALEQEARDNVSDDAEPEEVLDDDIREFYERQAEDKELDDKKLDDKVTAYNMKELEEGEEDGIS
jgi:hypothetical protein